MATAAAFMAASAIPFSRQNGGQDDPEWSCPSLEIGVDRVRENQKQKAVAKAHGSAGADFPRKHGLFRDGLNARSSYSHTAFRNGGRRWTASMELFLPELSPGTTRDYSFAHPIERSDQRGREKLVSHQRLARSPGANRGFFRVAAISSNPAQYPHRGGFADQRRP